MRVVIIAGAIALAACSNSGGVLQGSEPAGSEPPQSSASASMPTTTGPSTSSSSTTVAIAVEEATTPTTTAAPITAAPRVTAAAPTIEPSATEPAPSAQAIQWDPVPPQVPYSLVYGCDSVTLTNTGAERYTYWASHAFLESLTEMPDRWYPYIEPGQTIAIDATAPFAAGEHVTVWLDAGGDNHQVGALAVIFPC